MNHIRSTTIRLTLSYLAIIMTLSVAFSVALYNTGAHDIVRQRPPRTLIYGGQIEEPDTFNQFFTDRISQGEHDLLIHLILLNVMTLLIGAGLSYYLARLTLRPVENVMEAQARFSSDASHELRTPLTAIRARNEVALRKPKLNLAEAKEVIKSNLDEAIKLEKLSDGLLRLTRADGKHLEMKPVLLGEVANEAMNQFIKPAQAKNIQIEDSVPELRVMGDTGALTQAMAVLIDNAVKYGHEGDIVHLEGEANDGSAYLHVRDTGPGMRASDLPHIFDRFYRADHSRVRQGDNGYGLGLSIAKQIIEQHGGEISVSSLQGEGSVFTIRLPLAIPPPEEELKAS